MKKNLNKQKWNQWFAGLIDGDGCLRLSKSGYMSLEITMDLRDERALLEIRSKLNGSIKLRSKARAIRYRCHDKKNMVLALNILNGRCRNSNRIPQLKKLCKKMNIVFQPPEKLTLNNSWFAGFFDADVHP